MYSIQFTVEGRGAFPVDMLRYDCCFPDDQGSAMRIQIGARQGDSYSVKLSIFARTKAVAPTTARWQSFGWRVTEIGTPRKLG
jgi:hypothetical protein